MGQFLATAVVILLFTSIMITIVSSASVNFRSVSDVLIIPTPQKGMSTLLPQQQLRAGTAEPNEIWPFGFIPYAINNTFTQKHTNDIKEAMKRIEKKTCLRFRPRTASDRYYIFFQNHNDYGCGSYVGRQTSFIPQPLWVNPRCIDFNGLIHEIGHAIGMWHTQQRTDRDNYVTIDFGALEAGEKKGYITKAQIESAYTRVDKFPQNLKVSNYGVPYDYTSIMHYPRNWGQNIPRAMIPKDNPPKHYGSPKEMASWWDAPRDNVGLSRGDVEMITKMYKAECDKRGW